MKDLIYIYRYQVTTTLEITSCAFLLMTLLVYVCLPSLQNLHGKTLMCHVSSLFLAFTCLAIIPWIMPASIVETEELRAMTSCRALGWLRDTPSYIPGNMYNIQTTLWKWENIFPAYTMLFCFLSSFSWLNVMCFDIWWTFG